MPLIRSGRSHTCSVPTTRCWNSLPIYLPHCIPTYVPDCRRTGISLHSNCIPVIFQTPRRCWCKALWTCHGRGGGKGGVNSHPKSRVHIFTSASPPTTPACTTPPYNPNPHNNNPPPDRSERPSVPHSWCNPRIQLATDGTTGRHPLRPTL
jgi:hypothetical protein